MYRLVFVGALFGAMLGCADQKSAPSRSAGSAAGVLAQGGLGDVQFVREPAKEGNPGAAAGGTAQRKVIQTANLDVLVTDFDEARRQFTNLIAEHKGYIAKSDFQGNVGAKRIGTWTVRVPAESFQAFIDATAALGQPLRHATQAEDVTEEFVDTEALVKNLKEEEEALNKLLKEKAQTLVDIAAWKEKVAVLRREISRHEARLQTLGRLTALSTANVTLRDEKEYVPPTAPSYTSSVRGTFDESLLTLRAFGKWVLIVLAALGPWLALLTPALVGLWWLRRRLRRSGRTLPPAVPLA